MTHDKFCPEGHGGQPCEDGVYCEAPCVCDELTAARADEREQAAQRILAAKEHLRTMPVTVSPAWSVWETQVIDACASAARGGEQA